MSLNIKEVKPSGAGRDDNQWQCAKSCQWPESRSEGEEKMTSPSKILSQCGFDLRAVCILNSSLRPRAESNGKFKISEFRDEVW